MAHKKLRVYLDEPTFLALAKNELDEMHFPANNTWRSKFMEKRRDYEGNEVPIKLFSFIGSYIKGKEHRTIERYVISVRPTTVKSKKLLGLISRTFPYYTIKLGDIVPISESPDFHADENIGRVKKWLL